MRAAGCFDETVSDFELVHFCMRGGWYWMVEVFVGSCRVIGAVRHKW